MGVHWKKKINYSWLKVKKKGAKGTKIELDFWD